MNKARRKAINEIYEQITDLRELLEFIKDEEEEYKDNIPENLQGSERYEKSEEACENLDSAICSIEEALDYISSSIE